MLILNKIDQAGEMGAGRVLADLYRKRAFSVHFGRHPKISGFTHGIVSQKPSQNQSPKNQPRGCVMGQPRSVPIGLALYFS
jgi:hypothetical protein